MIIFIISIPDQNASKGVFSRSPLGHFSSLPHSALPLFLLISLLFCHLTPPPSPPLRPSRPLLILVPSGSSGFTEPSHFLLHHRPDQSVPSIRSCHAEITQNHSEIKSRNPSNWKKKKWITSNLHLDYVGSPSDHWKTIKRIRSKYQPRTQTVGTRVTVLLLSDPRSPQTLPTTSEIMFGILFSSLTLSRIHFLHNLTLNHHLLWSTCFGVAGKVHEEFSEKLLLHRSVHPSISASLSFTRPRATP